VRIRTSGWSVVVVVVAAVIVGAAGAREDGPPAGQIAFVRFSAASAHPRIVALRLAGGAPRPLPLRVAAAGAPAWSPNGRELVFVGGVNAVGSSDLTGSTYSLRVACRSFAVAAADAARFTGRQRQLLA
jgi:Tol biopolymer transport system component